MKLIAALVAALSAANSISGNPDAPQVGPHTVGKVLETFRSKLAVYATGSIAGAGAAKVLGPEEADGTDIVGAELADMESVGLVVALDITNGAAYVYVPGVGAGKAIKIVSHDTTQVALIAANCVTVSGNLVTLGTGILANGATVVYFILGK